MDIKQEVDRLIKSAELYQGQGLYGDAQKAYAAASELIKSGSQIKNKETLLAGLSKKIRQLQERSGHVESAPATHALPGDVQDLIKNLFSFSEKKDPDTRALSEAVTLAKFGQLERAVSDLTPLLDRPSVGLVAAKNILRCMMLLPDPGRAGDTYLQWVDQARFSTRQLENLRRFLETLFAKKGLPMPLPKVSVVPGAKEEARSEPAPQENLLDIGSVLIHFDQGPLKGKPVELDVNFQTGNTVSLLIESKDKTLLDTLGIGFRLREVQYRSSVAIFRGGGVVSAKIMIHEGPKQGDYHLDIRVQDD